MYQFRKVGMAAIIVILLMSMITACGSSSKVESTEQPSTRVYKDGTGKDITIPADPQKIVAINYVGDLLALGVKPAYTTDYNLKSFTAELSGVSSVGNRPVNTESVISAAPDLIIADDTGDATEVEQLSKIAPTVTLTFWLTDPLDHLNMLAELLGKQAEARSWRETYDAKAADVKGKIKASISAGDETALLLIVSGQDMGISGIRNGGFTLYRQLGFAAPEKMKPLLAKDENFGFDTISLEALPEFNPDHLFVEMDDDSKLTKETFKQLQESPIFKSLAASKNNKVHVVSKIWGTGDALSLDKQLDDALEKLVR
jgi:iron complex transport system substrate-binding protein